jgi:nitrite reductase/ring-hydroxylating ferredoxin subunit
MSEFVRVASASDLPPGQAMVVELGGRTIAVFNVDGRFYALDNTCMHRGGPLGEGFVDRNNLTVQCPWHGWIYGLATGASPIDSMAKVETFEVIVQDGDLRVSLD